MAAVTATAAEAGKLRPVVIDGSNVAMQLGRSKHFACRGILICARHFIERGHHVTTFVPETRRRQNPDNFKRPMKDQHLLDWMHRKGFLNYTPCRTVVTEDQRRRIICYDDFNIVEYAHNTGGVIISKDQYRDVQEEHPEWAQTIRDRLVMFSWAGEMFLVAHDPFGRRGPRLEEVLRFKEGDPIAPNLPEWTADERATLLREINEILAAPPPPPPIVEVEPATSSIVMQEGTSISELAMYSIAPRYGFHRRDNYVGGGSGYNHRNRRWMQRDPLLSHTLRSSNGFGALTTTTEWNNNNDQAHTSTSNGFGAATTDVNEWKEHERVPSGSSSSDSAPESEELTIDPALFDHFCGVFPIDAVMEVMNQYKGIKDVEILSNLLADYVCLSI